MLNFEHMQSLVNGNSGVLPIHIGEPQSCGLTCPVFFFFFLPKSQALSACSFVLLEAWSLGTFPFFPHLSFPSMTVVSSEQPAWKPALEARAHVSVDVYTVVPKTDPSVPSLSRLRPRAYSGVGAGGYRIGTMAP